MMGDPTNTDLHRERNQTALDRSIAECGTEEDIAFHRKNLDNHLRREEVETIKQSMIDRLIICVFSMVWSNRLTDDYGRLTVVKVRGVRTALVESSMTRRETRTFLFKFFCWHI